MQTLVAYGYNWGLETSQGSQKKVADIRGDAPHKLTTCLARKHGTIVIEDLNWSEMLNIKSA